MGAVDGAEEVEAEGGEAIGEAFFESEELGGDGVDADFEEEVDAGFHAEDAVDVEGAGFVAAAAFFEGDFGLGDELGGADVPGAEEGGAELVLKGFFDVEDAGAHGAEHPFVGIGGEEVDVFDGGGEGADGLDGVEAEEDAAGAQHLADGVDLQAVAAEEVAGGEGDEAGFGGEGGFDEFGGDGAGGVGFEEADGDAFAAGEVGPGVDVGGVVVEVADDFVAGLPVEAGGDEGEADGGGADEGDFVGLGADEAGGGDACFGDGAPGFGVFLHAEAGLFGVVLHGGGDAAGEDADAGVGEEEAVLDDGEFLAAEGFVREEGVEGERHWGLRNWDCGLRNGAQMVLRVRAPSSMSCQKCLDLASCSSSPEPGRLLRKRKSWREWECMTRWMRTVWSLAAK